MFRREGGSHNMTGSAPARRGQGEGKIWPAPPLPQRERAFAFVVQRIARGESPTLEAIGIELGVSKQRARELIDQLVKAGRVGRTPGAVRALRILDVDAARLILDVVLSDLGWTVARAMGVLQPPFTNVKLPAPRELDHIPAHEVEKRRSGTDTAAG